MGKIGNNLRGLCGIMILGEILEYEYESRVGFF